jgi:transcriptional regulator with XRE-family HTH domain
MVRASLRQRVVENLRRLVKDRPRGWAASFCDRYQVWPSTLARTLSDQQAPTLDLLEQIAEMEGVSPLVLMAGPEEELKPVTHKEATLLRYVRPPLMPPATLDKLLGFLEHFASEPLEDRDERTARSYMRRMSDAQRHRVLAYMLMLTEGIPQDLEVLLSLPAADDGSTQQGRQSGARTKRRRA